MSPEDLAAASPAALRVAAYVTGMLAAEAGPDQPSHVIGIGATRDVTSDLRTQQHATAFAVAPVLGVEAPAGLAVPVTTRHAPALELLAGRRLRAALEGVVVLGHTDLPLQGPRVQFALGVTRDGDEVHGVGDGSGEGGTRLVPAAAALAPSDPAHDHAVLPGTLVAAARRYLELPTAPPAEDPWLLLGDTWATLVLDRLVTLRRTGADPARFARDAVALRPDVALLTQRRARAHLPGSPDAVALREAYVDPPPALATALPAAAVRAATDPGAVLQDITDAAAAERDDPTALWDAACVLFPAPEDGTRVAAPEWYDGNALVRHVVDVLGGRVGAVQELLAADDLPGWFTASTQAWLDGAGRGSR